MEIHHVKLMILYYDVAITIDTPERTEAATKNPHLKLLFRLLNFAIQDQSKALIIVDCYGLINST